MGRDESNQPAGSARYVFAGASPARGSSHLKELLPETDNETVRNVQRSIAYMREHINQPLQVATLAAFANVSPSHFFALFKQLTGCPPMGFFTRLRMSHASQLLGTTSASVKEIAAAMGYDDPFYFSRVFKSVNKIAPSEYRSRSKTPSSEGHDEPWNTRPDLNKRMVFIKTS
jgi:transcriptional regulator GlxA family with amidase domain